MRSARRIALHDQAQALLRDSPRCLTANEVTDRLGSRYYYSDVYPVLEALHGAGLVEKFKHPLLKHVLWGAPGSKGDLVVQYARLSKYAMKLRDALSRAPSPGPSTQSMEVYVAWWNGERKDAIAE